MALLQTSEPGLSAAPHRHRLAVGIDLGTTHSLVATVRSGTAEVIEDEDGRALLPSVVRYLPEGSSEVGAAARAQQSSDPANTIASVKRFMGRGLADVGGTGRVPYRFVDAPGMVQIETCAGVKSPVEISAEILTSLRTRAEAALGGDLVGAVITVPAYFDDAQRQATRDAARLAGLNVLRLLNEPTAAAVAYGLDQGSEGIYAVYDLGGGTFDFSILRLARGVFEVLATSGDAALGGDDFDHAIAAWAHSASAGPALGPSDTSALLTFAALTQALVAKTLAPVRRVRDAPARPRILPPGSATRPGAAGRVRAPRRPRTRRSQPCSRSVAPDCSDLDLRHARHRSGRRGAGAAGAGAGVGIEEGKTGGSRRVGEVDGHAVEQQPAFGGQEELEPVELEVCASPGNGAGATVNSEL